MNHVRQMLVLVYYINYLKTSVAVTGRKRTVSGLIRLVILSLECFIVKAFSSSLGRKKPYFL